MELVVHIRYKVQSIFPRLGSFRTGHESRRSWSTNSTDAAVVVVGAIVAVAVAVAVAQAHSGGGLAAGATSVQQVPYLRWAQTIIEEAGGFAVVESDGGCAPVPVPVRSAVVVEVSR